MTREATQDVAETFRSPQHGPGGNEWLRKKNRLPLGLYVGNAAYAVTSVVDGRRPEFSDSSVAQHAASTLKDAANAEDFTLLAWVFMPDHVHVLCQSNSDGASLPSFVKRFKQSTGFNFRKTTGRALWQKSYFDHIVRDEDDLSDLARYVANNPVAAGLVDDWADYAHVGGVLLEAEPRGDLKVSATSAAAFGDISQ